MKKQFIRPQSVYNLIFNKKGDQMEMKLYTLLTKVRK